MRCLGRPCLVLAVAIVVVGCAGRLVAPTGKDFARPALDSFELGRTRDSDIVGRYGAPTREGTMVRHGQRIRITSYGYSWAGGKPASPGVVPARSLTFYFVDGLLIGHSFVSSFQEDGTDFNAAGVAGIRAGETTEAQLRQLIGAPCGRYVFPLIAGKDDHALVYSYTQLALEGTSTSRRFRIHSKTLVVSVAPGGIVTDVDFIESGDRPGFGSPSTTA